MEILRIFKSVNILKLYQSLRFFKILLGVKMVALSRLLMQCLCSRNAVPVQQMQCLSSRNAVPVQQNLHEGGR